MTSNRLTLWTQRVAALFLFGLAVWAGPAPFQVGRLVPFVGTVEGTLTIGPTGEIEAPPAEMISSCLGQGTQVYEFVTVTQEERNGLVWLRAEGVAGSVAADGDVLRIEFLLEGPLTGTEFVPYRGRFEVLPGGTGRFAYEGRATNLGQGRLAGRAVLTLDPETGSITFAFRHQFAGTLRWPYSRGR